MLCVTNWNAVLELKPYPKIFTTEYGHDYRHEYLYVDYPRLVTVCDPNAVDAGMVILLDELKLVIRLKKWKP